MSVGKSPDRDGLTPRQWLFVEQYMVDKNAAQAAKRAGYRGKNATDALLAHPLVKAKIDEKLKALASKLEITAERVLNELAKIGFAEAAETLDNVPLLSVKRQALVNIGDHFGMFKQKIEHTGKDGGPIEYQSLDDLEIARRMVALLDKATGG